MGRFRPFFWSDIHPKSFFHGWWFIHEKFLLQKDFEVGSLWRALDLSFWSNIVAWDSMSMLRASPMMDGLSLWGFFFEKISRWVLVGSFEPLISKQHPYMELSHFLNLLFSLKCMRQGKGNLPPLGSWLLSYRPWRNECLSLQFY